MALKNKVLALAKKLRKVYTKENGQLSDGYLLDSFLKYVGNGSTAEDALHAAFRIMKIVQKQYKSNKKFQEAIDSDFLLKDGNGKARIKSLKQLHLDLFNYEFPGYLELLRMEKDPESQIVAENLGYFEGLYVEQEWKESI